MPAHAGARAGVRVMRQDAGLSMIEMIVAVLILSIAVVALFRVYDETLSSGAGQRDRAFSLIVAQNRVASLALGLPDLSDQVRFADQTWDVETDRVATSGGFTELRIRVTPAQGGPGTQLVTYLEAE